MDEKTLRIIQVSTADRLGGAEQVAWNLFSSYHTMGQKSHLAVGRRRTNDPNVQEILNSKGARGLKRLAWSLHERMQPSYGKFPGSRLMCRMLHRMAAPGSWFDVRNGVEDFHYPGTHNLLRMFGEQPDIIHCHNLHGNYFDLRILPDLAARVPMVLTLHDAWLLAGHCAHSFECDRWRTGCGDCPDLNIYPAIRRDATAFNWQRKSEIFSRSRVYVSTPSQWLMDQVTQSLIAPAIAEARVIPNGVNLNIFRPDDRDALRQSLGLPLEDNIVLFAAAGIRKNMWKDFKLLKEVVGAVAVRTKRKLRFIALGEEGKARRIGKAEINFVPFQSDARQVARYYQASDLYIHAARADTFPNTVVEALACGIPVVATAVGGIPEQVRCFSEYATERATGILVPRGNTEIFSNAIRHLLEDDRLRNRLAYNAASDVRQRFDLQAQVKTYLAWYRQIIEAEGPLGSARRLLGEMKRASGEEVQTAMR